MKSSPSTINFPNITPARWQEICTAVSAKGFTITGNSGSGSKSGVTIQYTYVPDSQLLELVISREWYDPSIQSIEAELTALVNSTQAL